MKTDTWILVANRARALILQAKNPGKRPQIIQVLLHPEGRLHDGELVTDRQGRVQEIGNSVHQTYAPSQRPSEHETELFVKQIVETVGTLTGWSPIVVFAEPKLLGQLNPVLRVKRAVSKNIAGWTDAKIVAAVHDDMKAERDSVVSPL